LGEGDTPPFRKKRRVSRGSVPIPFLAVCVQFDTIQFLTVLVFGLFFFNAFFYAFLVVIE
jgi:hypothetical protein